VTGLHLWASMILIKWKGLKRINGIINMFVFWSLVKYKNFKVTHVRATHGLLDGSSQCIHASFQKPTKVESWHSDGVIYTKPTKRQKEKRLTQRLRLCLEASCSHQTHTVCSPLSKRYNHELLLFFVDCSMVKGYVTQANVAGAIRGREPSTL
jgi:hypothetical protein